VDEELEARAMARRSTLFDPLQHALSRLADGLHPEASEAGAAVPLTVLVPVPLAMTGGGGGESAVVGGGGGGGACAVAWTPQFASKRCSICLEDFTAADTLHVLGCLHGFHPTCVAEWRRRGGRCPVCRE
jgi:hypothetical protein